MRTESQHTAATRHPGWDGIVAAIESRFPHNKPVQDWCIDAVSAHLLGVPDRAQQDLRCLGETLSGALTEICAKHGVDLTSI